MLKYCSILLFIVLSGSWAFLSNSIVAAKNRPSKAYNEFHYGMVTKKLDGSEYSKKENTVKNKEGIFISVSKTNSRDRQFRLAGLSHFTRYMGQLDKDLLYKRLLNWPTQNISRSYPTLPVGIIESAKEVLTSSVNS